VKSCAVLGNGPGLTRENIPAGAFLVGVNRSYKVARSPIICTVDGQAAREAYAESGAALFCVKRGALPFGMRGVASYDPPEWAWNSGAFGIWIAAQMGFERIYLVGFGGRGKFDSDDDINRDYYQRNIAAAIQFAAERQVEVARSWEEVMA